MFSIMEYILKKTLHNFLILNPALDRWFVESNRQNHISFISTVWAFTTSQNYSHDFIRFSREPKRVNDAHNKVTKILAFLSAAAVLPFIFSHTL